MLKRAALSLRTILLMALTMGLSWFPVAWADLSDGLVLHFEFEGNAQDSSSYANHGIENDVEYVAGKRGEHAVSFNGNGAFIKIPDADSLDTDHVMTIATWINPNTATDPNRTDAIFAAKWNTTWQDTNEGDWIFRWYGKIDDSTSFVAANYSEAGVENGDLSVIGGIVPRNTWQHVAATFDNGQVKTYLNGTLVNEEKFTINHTEKNEYIHDDIFLGQTWLGTYAYKGLMDDFRLYNRALSKAEIQQLYQMDNQPDDCWAIYKNGSLHIPCVKVIGPFGDELHYEADMQYEPLSEPMSFQLTGAKPK